MNDWLIGGIALLLLAILWIGVLGTLYGADSDEWEKIEARYNKETIFIDSIIRLIIIFYPAYLLWNKGTEYLKKAEGKK